MKKLKKNQ
jgi:hypothetical protein